MFSSVTDLSSLSFVIWVKKDSQGPRRRRTLVSIYRFFFSSTVSAVTLGSLCLQKKVVIFVRRVILLFEWGRDGTSSHL